MSKTLLKCLFSFSFLLLLGNQQLQAYGLISNDQAFSKYDNFSGNEDFDGFASIHSPFAASHQKQQHVVAEEKVEEEEKRLDQVEDFSRNDFLSSSAAHFFLSFFFWELPKKNILTHPFFSHFSSFKRYLRFEVFRI